MISRQILLLAVMLVLGRVATGSDGQEAEHSGFSLLFVNGTEGYAVYRCPSMVVTNSGTILAFTEGRVNSHEDEDDMDIVLKRSTDGGQTWGPLIVVEDDGKNPCKNQVPVVLPSGRILLIWLWNEWIPSEAERDTREVYITYSDDDGLTWAPSRNITSMTYGEGWGWYGTGPGHGIIKVREPHMERIIIPARHNIRGVQKMKSHLIFSDDGGETWSIGAIALREESNESTVVELSNGDLMLNSRNGLDEQNARIVHISRDGGGSFEELYLDLTLRDAGACQGSILDHSLNNETGKSNILFSNPHHATNRVNGTIHLSMDDGKTWSKKFVYSNPAPAFSGYSDIAVLNEGGDVAVLFETGESHEKPLRWYGEDCGIAFRVVRFNDINEPVFHIDFGNWAIYDGSVLLEDAWPGWTKDRTTSGITDVPGSVFYTVVDDPELEGNKVLKVENLTGTSRESWQLDWQLAWSRTGLTLLFRTKPTQGILDHAPTSEQDAKLLYISPRNGLYQEALAFYYPDRLTFSQSGVTTTYAEYGWTVYRLTMVHNVVKLYINEDPVPVLSAFTQKTTSDNRLLLGDNTLEPYGGFFDWIIWDLSGAYPPGEAPPLPEQLTGLPCETEGGKITGIHKNRLNIYPNPVSSHVTISYTVETASYIHLDMVDITGKLKLMLVNEFQEQGSYERFIGIDDLPPGIYICRFRTEKGLFLRKLIKN